MKEKRINLEKNLHINMKWLENLATEFNEYYRLNEDKKPIKAPFSIELNSVGFLTNQVIKKS
jgi:hypothetical protein